jgi:hypothetical protein
MVSGETAKQASTILRVAVLTIVTRRFVTSEAVGWNKGFLKWLRNNTQCNSAPSYFGDEIKTKSYHDQKRNL